VLKEDRGPMNTDYRHYKVTRKNHFAVLL